MIKYDRKVKSTCSYCGVGCQIELNIKDDKIISSGAPEDTAPNYGRLCVKGRFGTDYTHHPSRLTKPLIRKDLDSGKRIPIGLDGFREASWEEALGSSAMAHVILKEKLYNKDFIDSRTEGFESYSLSLNTFTPEWAETITGVPAEDIRSAARIYAEANAAAIYWGMGISQSVMGQITRFL